MVRRQVYLTKIQIAALKAEAKTHGITFSELLRRVLDRHIASSPAKR